jgi:hypothetical protein
MKKILILLLLVSGYCYSQQPVFNFEKDKLYKIKINGVENAKDADMIARMTEKNLISVFSYVDFTTGDGLFIVDNFYKVHEIEKLINNQERFAYVSFEEIPLTNDNFLNMYMKRGGFRDEDFSTNPPKKIMMGPFNGLTNDLYKKAESVWVELYPDKKELIESYYIEKLEKELPKFIDTGNPEKDNKKYLEAKDKWVKENPEKYQRYLKFKVEQNPNK